MTILRALGRHSLSVSLKIALFFISTITVLLFCELLFRLYLRNVIPASDPMDYSGQINNESQFITIIRGKHILPNNFNIYYFGESTMKGEPYVDIIPTVVEKIVNNEVDSKTLSWVNLADWGIDIDATKTRIQWVIRHKNTLTFPSLFVIYSGHNEFLQYHKDWGFSISKHYDKYLSWFIEKSDIAKLLAEKMKLYKLDIDERSYFDTPAYTADQFDATISNYTQNISQIISLANENQIPVIIFTVVGNYADFEPNRSVYCTDHSNISVFKDYMDKGAELDKQQEYEDAIISYQNALALCDTFAETYFRLGKTYQMLGDDAKAYDSFDRALNLDQMPIRALSVQNEYIRNVNKNNDTRVVDTEAYLRQHADNGNIGYNLMSDGHHPNLKGYVLISTLIAQTIAQEFPLSTTVFPVSEADVRPLILETQDQVYSAAVSSAEWLIRLSTWRYDPRDRLNKAELYLNQAIAINPEAVAAYLHQMVISYIRKDVRKAADLYQKAMNIDSVATKKFLRSHWIYQIIERANENNL